MSAAEAAGFELPLRGHSHPFEGRLVGDRRYEQSAVLAERDEAPIAEALDFALADSPHGPSVLSKSFESIPADDCEFSELACSRRRMLGPERV